MSAIKEKRESLEVVERRASRWGVIIIYIKYQTIKIFLYKNTKKEAKGLLSYFENIIDILLFISKKHV